jgi:hypothetical protein
MTGRAVVRAVAFVRPVVEPLSTLTIASTLRCAAASRARRRAGPGDVARDIHLPLGRDHHDPAGGERSGLAGAEADPLRQGVVDEAHA